MYAGGSTALQTQVSGDDDGCGSGRAHSYATLLVAVEYRAGNYTLVVEGFGGSAGAFSVQMQCATSAPSVRPISVAPTAPGETYAPTARPSASPTLLPTIAPLQPYCADVALGVVPLPSPTVAPTVTPTVAPTSAPVLTQAPTAPAPQCPETTEENRTSCGPGTVFLCGDCHVSPHPVGNISVFNRASMSAAQVQVEMLQLYLGEGAIPAPGANGTGINSTAYIDAQLRFRNASFHARVAAGTFSLVGAAVAIHNYSHLIATDPSLSNFTGQPNLPLTSVWDCAYCHSNYVDEQTCITVRRIAVVNGTIFRRFDVHYSHVAPVPPWCRQPRAHHAMFVCSACAGVLEAGSRRRGGLCDRAASHHHCGAR